MSKSATTPAKYDNVHQIGGMTLAKLAPAFGDGLEQGVRSVLVNTGSGLRFTVALDRGGDIVDAFFNQHSLAYLSAVGLRLPSHAYTRGFDWLFNWPGGLMTCCGPHTIGGPRQIDGLEHGLHGRHSNLPADVEMMLNPDPLHGRKEMLLSLVVRDARMFGPVLELRRQIQCVLGEPSIRVFDQVTNRGDTPVDHNWLYHVNLGYPLLDEGAKFIYRGKAEYWQLPKPDPMPKLTPAFLRHRKTAPAPLCEDCGSNERGMIIEVEPDSNGRAHVGLVNSKLGLAFELDFPVSAMPRIANWQHYGPNGSYVTGIEPFAGSLFGLDTDKHPAAHQRLNPGETKRYELTFTVHATKQAIAQFVKHDGDVTAR
ncbi:MAG: DUF4432 family protein [Phycisphaeraceae bacterium]|nr:DUF4432 family protein [Phycisphaeraceae bacterium]